MNEQTEQDQEVAESPFKDELPVGIVTGDEGWMRHYVLRELTSADSRRIHDKDLANKRPMEWMARIIALSLESLDGEPIYAEYQKVNFNAIPDLVKRIPMADATYLMTASHINSFGPKIEAMRFICPYCKRGTVMTVDLNSLEVSRSEGNPIQEIRAELDKGFRYTGEKAELLNRVFNVYVMRVPTVGDFIKNQEKFVKGGPTGRDINSQIIKTCLTQVIDADGQEMDKNSRQMLGLGILDDLPASDYETIVDAVNDVPGIDRRVEFTCGNPMCGAEVIRAVDVSFFFPRG